MTTFNSLDAADQQTLRLAPLWLVGALVGQSRLDAWELDALLASVRAAIPTTTGLGNDVLRSLADDPGLTAAYERDGRPIVTGLLDAMTTAGRLSPEAGSSLRDALLAVGEGVARARGPYGRSVSRQDAETLELLAEVLDLDAADPRGLFSPA